jgi:hypothetical protein
MFTSIVTLEPITDPVVAADGFIYEKSEFKQLVEKDVASHITGNKDYLKMPFVRLTELDVVTDEKLEDPVVAFYNFKFLFYGVVNRSTIYKMFTNLKTNKFIIPHDECGYLAFEYDEPSKIQLVSVIQLRQLHGAPCQPVEIFQPTLAPISVVYERFKDYKRLANYNFNADVLENKIIICETLKIGKSHKFFNCIFIGCDMTLENRIQFIACEFVACNIRGSGIGEETSFYGSNFRKGSSVDIAIELGATWKRCPRNLYREELRRRGVV